jgi:uncharacterized SAM-binding protein YcdF (DUF218 family)
MLRRAFSLVVLFWALGFILFAVTLPRPAEATRTEAVVVPTGGGGRIERALDLLHLGAAQLLFVSGVDKDVKPGEFRAEYHVSTAAMACCVILGYESVDTRSNAKEISAWVQRRHIRSVRLVTSSWHMRRAAFELSRKLPKGVVLIKDAVPSQPSFRGLFLEYNKLIASWIAAQVGL